MKQASPPFESTYMALAVELARKSLPSPNPRVGAVLVRDGHVIGQGYHLKPGAPHAEVVAIQDAGNNTVGADLYVTLEPCRHVGRTGPCVKAVEKAGIRRVFIGMSDPDIRVNGQGIAYLKEAGIEVVEGVDEFHCQRLLRGYASHRTKGRPFVTIKAAITLDGYLATKSRDSKWISSKASRRTAHALRADVDAILVGIETVIHDNPMLTVRDAEGPSPLRVILDSNLRIPHNAAILQTADSTPVILAHAHRDLKPQNDLSKMNGVELLACSQSETGRVELSSVMDKLGQRGVMSLLVEGGSNVISAFFKAKLCDELILFIAPRILGAGIPFTTYPNANTIQEGLSIKVTETTLIDDDVFYRATINYPD